MPTLSERRRGQNCSQNHSSDSSARSCQTRWARVPRRSFSPARFSARPRKADSGTRFTLEGILARPLRRGGAVAEGPKAQVFDPKLPRLLGSNFRAPGGESGDPPGWYEVNRWFASRAGDRAIHLVPSRKKSFLAKKGLFLRLPFGYKGQKWVKNRVFDF